MDGKHLPRLDPSEYRGFAIVHWSLSIKDRKTGWLNPSFHVRFREVLIHGLARYHALCASYCLMPDHAHLLLLGWSEQCDQRLLVRFLRKHTNPVLKMSGCQWQKEPYDNVLREKDRERFSFENITCYLLENPVRANLVQSWQDWIYVDSLIPGYPDISIRNEAFEDFWNRFWRVYYDGRDRSSVS